MNEDLVASNGTAAASESNGSRGTKNPPSVISKQLRDELLRILTKGDDKNEGAFTVAIATQVEKFVVAAREILMTENLAQHDISSLMMSRRQTGPYGSFGYLGSSLGTDSLPLPSVVNNENFGVQAIRQIVEASRTMAESPGKLVEALVVARSNNLPDVVAALEAKLGVGKKNALPAGDSSESSTEGSAS